MPCLVTRCHKVAAMDPSALDSREPAVVTDNEAESRFEIRVGGELAGFIGYILDESLIDLVHTEVDPRFQGGGLAGQLARASLDSARNRGLAVLPTCPFIRSWIRKHPEYKDLVPEDRRSAFRL
jgi:predicted GNAT family acetyltransferase